MILIIKEMSRKSTPIGMLVDKEGLLLDHPISIHKGYDHVLGSFLQISDKRFASSRFDLQGEGYVFEWDEFSGITTNKINAIISDIVDEQTLILKTDLFIRFLGIVK